MYTVWVTLADSDYRVLLARGATYNGSMMQMMTVGRLLADVRGPYDCRVMVDSIDRLTIADNRGLVAQVWREKETV